MAEGWTVKVERSRARGRVASNTLTVCAGAIPSRHRNCFGGDFHESEFLEETFSQRASVGQRLNAQPAIRVEARRLAQYNLSELLSWKTSAPNLPNGWLLATKGDAGRAPFSENRFMSSCSHRNLGCLLQFNS